MRNAGAMRLAGVTLPLFSVRTERDWGIGQITDLPAAGRWLRTGGFRLLQILPPYELADGETSPYGARTGFGVDPIFVDAGAAPGAAPLEGADAALRERLRAEDRVDHAAVRALKLRALRAAFDRCDARGDTGEARAFAAREAGWEADLALYVALRGEHGGRGWETWPAALRDRDAAALEEARRRLDRETRFHEWLQWVAFSQWARAREELAKDGVLLMGDLPFAVCAESADVWAHRRLFRLGKSLGAPPDEFDPELGQDWGLPPYDWAALDADDLGWLLARARHAARLYDAFRVDHVIGYFRQYVRPPKALGAFDPEDELDAEEHGRRLLRALRDAAKPAAVIAEDLGVIPPWARRVLAELGLPGYKVLPWEKDEDGALRDPRRFSPHSVASWSTHDTRPVTAWWREFDEDEQGAWATRGGFDVGAPASERWLGLARVLFGAGSDLTLMLAPEVLGEHARINTPGSIGDHNWTYRLPRPIEALSRDAAVVRRMDALRTAAAAAHR